MKLMPKIAKETKTILVHMMTGKDNATTDVIRVLGSIGFLSIVLFGGYITFLTGEFSAIEYSTGLGGYLGAWAGALYFKHKTEPDPCNHKQEIDNVTKD